MLTRNNTPFSSCPHYANLVTSIITVRLHAPHDFNRFRVREYVELACKCLVAGLLIDTNRARHVDPSAVPGQCV